MKALLDAIIAKFTSASLSSTVAGGIHLGKAPSGTAFIFLVVTPIVSPTTDSFGGTTHYDATIDFQLFGDAASTLIAAAETVMAAYDNVTLTLTGATQIGVYRASQPILLPQPPEEPKNSDSAKTVYGCHWSYVYTVQ